MATFSNFTEVGLIDTRNNPGTITLPLTTSLPLRTLRFKDIYGTLSLRTLTLNTQGSDLFEDGTSSKTFSNDFGFMQLYAGGNNRWYILNGSVLTSQTVSSLTVSSIQGDGSRLFNLPAISTASLQSTVIGLGNVGYASTAQVNQLSNFTRNILQDFSTGLSTVALFTSTTSNFSRNILQDFSTGLSTVALFTSNTSNFATNILQNYSSFTISTTIGLGSAGYISSSQLFSTVTGIGSGFNGSTMQLSAGQILVSSIPSQLTTSTLLVSGSELIRFNGTAAPTAYGLSTDTLTLQSSSNAYANGIASLAFANNTSGYPLARIYAVDSASSGPAISQLVFQTVPVSATTFNNNFSFTGSDQTFTVPTGVTTMQVTMWGGGGGANGAVAGAGAFIRGTLSVTPGQQFTVIVGNGGSSGGGGGGRSALRTTIPVNITSASGSGSVVTYTTSQAHGLSAGQPVIISGFTPSGYNGTFAIVSIPSGNQFTVSNSTTGTSSGTGILIAEIIIVGGGGGANGVFNPYGQGNGGAATFSGTAFSGTAIQRYGGETGGGGGSQTAGGAPGSGNQGNTGGSLLTGGIGSSSCGSGGQGYYGGGGGGSTGRGDSGGGGGGSSWTGFSGFTLTLGLNSPNSLNQAPGTSISGYVSGVAVGASGTAAGGAGYVILASVGNALSEAMRIGSNAFIGIGTTSPQTNLDVVGTGRFTTVSTLQLNVRSTVVNFGNASTLTDIQFFGLQGNYNNTALAEISTGTGIQEFLVFKGSSVNDRIRMQTTGSIVFESGVASRLWSDNATTTLANAIPSFIIDTTSNVGIQTAAPGATLDVAGSIRGITFSTQALNVSTINGQTIGGPIISTVVGLGTAGYASTSLVNQLSNFTRNILQDFSTGLSTVALFTSNTSNFSRNILQDFSTGLSTVALFTSNTSNFSRNILQDFSTQTLSSVIGLGSAGYISSTQLFSTVRGLSGTSVLPSSISTGSISTGSIIIPYSTLSLTSFALLRTTSTQMGIGALGPPSQLYIGDVLGGLGNITDTSPLVLLEQLTSSVPITQNFSFTGADQTFTVPAGVTSLNVVLNGAGGGTGDFNSPGGSGGRVSGTLAVTPGETLTLVVGAGGFKGQGSVIYGGGGTAGYTGGLYKAGGGGGRTAIRRSGADIVTAGGGGGGFSALSGGNGGGLVGADGGGTYNGKGGTQTAGGAAPSIFTTAGSLGVGGNGDNQTAGYGGGGGGGGYYGGSGGGDGGGGGSSYVANLTGTVVNTQGGGSAANTAGSLSITYSPSITTRAGNVLEIRNPNNTKLFIDNNLNLGINTNTIGSGLQLDVNGNARAISVSTLGLNVSTINGQTIGGPIISTVIGLGTAGYASTAQVNQLSNFTRNLLQDFSTGLSTVGLFTSNTSNFTRNILQDFSTGLSTVAFFTSNTSNFALNILQNYSSFTISTTIGLGTAGYISSTQLFSTVTGIGSGFTGSTNSLSSGQVIASTLSSVNIFASQGSISSLTVNSLSFGTGDGFLEMGDIVANSVSSITQRVGTIVSMSNLIGITSTQSAIQFFGLTGQYGNTVLEEQTTGLGTQEFLVFKGSSVSDRIRLATTGNLVFESGIVSQTFTNNTALATPSMIINSSSNVGIQTATPGATLDVAGTIRGVTLSTQALNISTINGQTIGGPILSTVVGLGTAGYISSSQLFSTVTGLGAGGGGSSSNVAAFTISTGTLFASTMSFVNINPSTMNMWIALSYDNSPGGTISYSSNGINWSSNGITGGFNDRGLGVAFNGRNWVAVGNLAAGAGSQHSTIKYSFNGINWSNAASGGFAGSPGTGVGGRDVAWNGRLWVAVGQDSGNFNIKYSSDSSNWSNTAATGFTTSGSGVAWNGQLWVAVGYDSTSANTIKYSTDALTWSNSAGLGFSSGGNGVAWNGRMWVAVGNDAVANNRIKYSFDGINWLNSAGIGFTSQAYGVAWNGRMWVAVGADSVRNNAIKYSYDGINWSNSAGIGFTGFGYKVSWNGNLWVAIGDDNPGTGQINLKYSSDGINWSNSPSLTGFFGFAVAYSSNTIPAYSQSNLTIMAQGIPTFFTSTNQITPLASSMIINDTLIIDRQWDRVGINCNIPQYTLDIAGTLNVSGAGNFSNISVSTPTSNLWVATGSDATQANRVKYSLDGITWSNSRINSFTGDVYGVGFNGSVWLAVGTGSATTSINYSVNGIDWLPVSNNAFSSLGWSVAWNGRFWVATGSGGAGIKYSINGLNWSDAVGGFSSSGRGLAWNGRMWVAVGFDASAQIKYSFDSINWSNSASGNFTSAAYDVATNGSLFVAVGYDSTGVNTIKYSRDGSNWLNSPTGFTSFGNGVAWNGRMWVAVGQDTFGTATGRILSSYDALTWTPSVSVPTGSPAQKIAWNGSLWVATSTDTATRANQMMYSSDGRTWTASSGATFGSSGAWGIGFSSNTVPSYSQTNMNILSQNIPVFTTSTNQFFAQPSSLVINETILIDRVWNRVGINTTIPQFSLDVNGSVNVSSLNIQSTPFQNIIASTVIGLGNIYLSTGGGGGGGITQANITSTIDGLGTYRYVSTLSLQSTIQGLGNIYVSTAASGLVQADLTSTTRGLGNIYLSSGVVTVTSLTANQFVSTQALNVSSFFTATRQMTPMFVTF